MNKSGFIRGNQNENRNEQNEINDVFMKFRQK